MNHVPSKAISAEDANLAECDESKLRLRLQDAPFGVWKGSVARTRDNGSDPKG